MKRIVVAISTCLAVCVALSSLSAQPGPAKNPKLIKSWEGTVANDKLIDQAPRNSKALQGGGGFVGDNDAWVKLWKSWRGDPQVPAVDFTKELVLVFTHGGPNKIGISKLQIDDAGDLHAQTVATLIGGPGFCYKFATVNREGIKSVNGTKVPQ